MPKRGSRWPRPPIGPSPLRVPASGRRTEIADEPAGAVAPPRAVRSDAMALAAEVDALRAKLTAARAKIAELEVKAEVDALTEVLNRRGFERELERSLAYVKRYGTRVALVYLDLDRFKSVNDRHGHAAGDAILKAVAATLVRHVRASDTVARLGGDEFVVLMWNIGEADVSAKTAALEAAIGAIAIRWQESVLSVGVSIGIVALGPPDRAADVLDRADRAMYARKRARAQAVPPRSKPC